MTGTMRGGAHGAHEWRPDADVNVAKEAKARRSVTAGPRS